MKVHNPDNTAVNTNSDPSPNDLKVQGQALFSFEFHGFHEVSRKRGLRWRPRICHHSKIQKEVHSLTKDICDLPSEMFVERVRMSSAW